MITGSDRVDRPITKLIDASRPVSGRLSLGILASAAALGAGVGLTATAALLIARASQMPPVITLWIAIAGVRFFGIARPVFRYVGRLISHDAAFRVVAEFRTKVYERLIPLTPSRLGRHHRGQILAGLVSDVDAVQEFDLRVLEPGAVAALVSAGCVALGVAILPSAGAVLAAGFVVAGIAAPLMAAAALRRATVSLAPVRAAMSAAVVDVLRGAPDLIAMGATEQKLAEIDRLDAELTRMARRAAWATGVGTGVAMLAAGASVWGAAVVAPPAVHDGRLAGVMVAVIVLLPWPPSRHWCRCHRPLCLSAACGALLGDCSDCSTRRPRSPSRPCRSPCPGACTRSSCVRPRLGGRTAGLAFLTTSIWP
jgi:ATP-binding cassette subfamily C protein CydCD